MALSTLLLAALTLAPRPYVASSTLASPHAVQAAAADEKYVYAISSTRVARYERATGRLLGLSAGKAEHLNSGFLYGGKLYCAHSNYPRLPHASEIKVLDPGTMKLETFHTFGDPPGSLTWAVRTGDHWWCTFAHYGSQNDKTVLVKLDDSWREEGRWKYPRAVIARWGGASCSGGVWHDGTFLTTGHDHQELYRLRLPERGDTLELVETIPCPFTGQGIAVDPGTGGLAGISRKEKKVILARRAER